MKQTAVEWLGFELNMLLIGITDEQWDKAEKLFQQAKEMEKEQQGYSEEEEKFKECYFIASTKTTSATICESCGKEKFLHKP